MYVKGVFRGLAALVLTCLFTLPAAAETERALGTVTVAMSVGALAHDVTSPVINVTVSSAPASDVTLNIALGGTVGSEASIITGGLTFGPGITTRTFQLKAGTNIGTIVLNYSLSGTNAGDYATPAPHNVFVQGRLTTSPVIPSIVTGNSQTFTITPSRAVLSDLTVTITHSGTAGYTVTPSVLVFPAGQVAQSFTVATTSAGSISLSFARSGSDVNRFGPAAPMTINVTNPNTPAGQNVVVEFPVSATVPVPLKITFAQVTTAGTTTAGTRVSTPAPPSGFQVVGGGLNFAYGTTAVVVPPTKVCATYTNGIVGDESALRLFRRTGVNAWTDVTSSVDPSSNMLCGTFPAVSGQFAIFTLNDAPVVGAITAPAGIITTGTAATFTATFTDANATDSHTGTFVWGTGTAPATITNVNGVLTATGEITFATSGTHQLYLVIDDGGQQAFSETLEVIADAGPPVIDAITATPGNIWPPDNKMHDVVLTVSATDDSGTPVCTITGVSMPGITAADYVITGALTVQLKAFPHRSYQITVTCTDAVGRTATKVVTVSVERQ